MKYSTLFLLLICSSLSLKAQRISFENLKELIETDSLSTFKILSDKGWVFERIKNSEKYKTFIWYFDGHLNNPSNNKGIVAQYWFQRAYSKTSKYQSVDYIMNESDYKFLVAELGNIPIKELKRGNLSDKLFITYTDGKYIFDLIDYQLESKKYGIIISKND
ncbi:hypothetical protein [Daejeonella sp.]|jgi:hypothetical protein|uniref:hypothetical protein n=1 Tax=Daejeonella sp. TaxID=2805397 RepID=UPI0037BE6B34